MYKSRETIKEHSSINPMICTLEDRLTHVFSQFHTPNNPPYAAMIQSALLELNERGGSTEKSISDFIKRQYNDLPWAHCSFLKHHLGLLSENGEIIVTSGFRYSLCSAGSSKGGKKRRRKKSRSDFEKKRNKRQKLMVAKSQKENEIGVIKDPIQVKDQKENSTELHGWKNNEDGIQELPSPERPPGFEFMAVGASSNEVSIVNTDPLQISVLIATEADIAENLKKDDLPCLLQPIQEKKKGRQFDKVIEQREVLLALPTPQGGSPLLGDGPMQHERSQRQLKRWSVNLPGISQTEEIEITPEIEKSHALKKLPSEYTFISGRKTNIGTSQRQSGTRQQPVLVSPSPSTDLQQDEDRNSQGVFRRDKDMPLRIYQRRRFRCPKADTDTIVQDELPPADIQKQHAEELPNLPCCHNLQEKTSEATLIKMDVTFPNLKDNSDKDYQLETSKPRGRGRPPSRNLGVNNGKDGQSSPRIHQQHAQMPLRGSRQSPRNMLKNLYNLNKMI